MNSNRACITPTDSNDRIKALDVVRAVALFGVLGMNAVSLAGNPKTQGLIDTLVVFFRTAFVEGKSVSIFSMLFGVGIFMQMERGFAKRADFAWFSVRRMSVLALIGISHFVIVYSGDILFVYAVVGVILLLMARVKPRTCLIVAVAVFGIFESFTPFVRHANFNHDLLIGEWVERMASPGGRIYGGGSWLDCVIWRLSTMTKPYYIMAKLIDNIGFTLPMFLVGGAIWKSRILLDPQKRKNLVVLFKLTLWMGIIINLLCGFSERSHVMTIPVAIKDLGVYALAVGYFSGLWLFLTGNHTIKIAVPFMSLSCLGRMALTNYVGYSVILSTIFYHFGVGLWGKIGPAGLMLLTIVLYGLSATFSILWLRWFKFGPMEWVWRSLAYGHCQPLLIRVATTIPLCSLAPED